MTRSRSLDRPTVAMAGARPLPGPKVVPIASMLIVGPSPVRESTGASGPSRTDWRS